MLVEQSLQDFFASALRDALHQEGLQLEAPGFEYLVQVCVAFAEQKHLSAHQTPGEPGTPTLAFMVDRARSVPPSQRFEAYRSLGDVALVVSGLFAPHVERARCSVGRRYYVDMGRAAYSAAASLARADLFQHVLRELAHQFQPLVEALSRVAEHAVMPTVTEPGALFERWQENHSASALRGLARQGLGPVFRGSATA